MVNRLHRRRLLGFLVVAILPLTLWAHTPIRPDLPRHGGEVQRSGDLYLELVAEDGRVAVFARDKRARPVNLGDTEAQAMIWTDDGSTVVPLTEGKNASLIAAAELPAASDFRVIVTLKRPDTETSRVLFGPLSLTETPH